MNCNKEIYIYIRRAYLNFLSFLLFFLFIIRYITLTNHKESYIFSPYGYNLNLSNLPLNWIVPFIITLYLFSCLLPKKLVLYREDKVINFTKKLFYIECILYILAISLFGMRMGSQASFLAQIISLFIFSLVPFSLCAFILLLLEPKIKLKVACLYIIPTILVASKSGLIHFFIMFIFTKSLRGERLLSKNIIILGLVIFAMYPIFMLLASYGRNGSGNIIKFSIDEIKYYGDTILSVYSYIFIQFSKRISGIDVLLLPELNNNIFSVITIIFFAIKGIFTTSIVNIILGINNFGMGKLFAIEYIGLNPKLASSFEPTLLGVIYLSNNSILAGVVIFFILFLTTEFFKLFKGTLSKIMLSYYAYTIVITVMTGLVTQLTQPIRFWLFFMVLYLTYSRFIRRKNKN